MTRLPSWLRRRRKPKRGSSSSHSMCSALPAGSVSAATTLLVSFTGFLSLGGGRHWGGTRPPPHGRCFEHAPRARAAHRAVPDELDRHSRLLQLSGASVPNRHHVELAVADELLRLVALPPPHFDVRLDLVELPERAPDVERIKPIHRHTVGDQRKNQRARGIVDAQAAAAREFLDVLEIDPASGAATGEFVGAVAKIRALNVGGDAVAVGDDGFRRQRALLEDRPIDRFGQSFHRPLDRRERLIYFPLPPPAPGAG